jgi:NAD(P)-dependent dehydrogenase (short-subunit alcohol dehydrogenase family)
MPDVASRFRLDGKVALVTAAGGGFGSAICRGLAEQGADIAVTDLREEAAAAVATEVRQRGRRALCLACDIGDPAHIERTVAATVDQLGRIDVLVNVACAAVLRPILDMTADDFDRTMASCLRGAFLASQAVGRVMVRQGGGGTVIHISSIASARALGRGTGIYAAGKAGVNALVRELAVEWAPHRIRVNAIAPCQFRTASFEKLLDDPRFGGREHLTAKITARIPLGRFGEPEEIVGPVVFLASEASSMVTGHVLFLDGGFMAY